MLLLLGVQGKNTIQLADLAEDPLMLPGVFQKLPQIRPMTLAVNRDGRVQLPHQCRQEIQVMAQNHIRPEHLHRFYNGFAERPEKLLGHSFVDIAIACAGIGHFIRHSAHCKRNVLALIVNRKYSDLMRQMDHILMNRSADHRLLMPRLVKSANQLCQENTATGTVCFLSCHT